VAGSLADLQEGPDALLGAGAPPAPLAYLSCPRTTPDPCVVLCRLT
jgi:hypothetical protein